MRTLATPLLAAAVLASSLFVAGPAEAAHKHRHHKGHHHKVHHGKLTKAELRKVRRLSAQVHQVKAKPVAASSYQYPGDPGQIPAPVGSPKVPILPGVSHCGFYIPIVVNGTTFLTCG